MTSDYTIWENHLGMPKHFLNYAFPAWPRPQFLLRAGKRVRIYDSLVLRYTMTFIPSVLMTVVALAFLRSNEILFAKSMAESEQGSANALEPSVAHASAAVWCAKDLDWLPVGPLSSWTYHWILLKAVCEGITDGFRGIFVDAAHSEFGGPVLDSCSMFVRILIERA